MGMGILVGLATVCGPAGVRNADDVVAFEDL